MGGGEGGGGRGKWGTQRGPFFVCLFWVGGGSVLCRRVRLVAPPPLSLIISRLCQTCTIDTIIVLSMTLLYWCIKSLRCAFVLLMLWTSRGRGPSCRERKGDTPLWLRPLFALCDGRVPTQHLVGAIIITWQYILLFFFCARNVLRTNVDT